MRLGEEVRGVVELGSERPGEKPSLYEDKLSVTHLFLEEGMLGFVGLSLLISGDEGFAGGFGELDGTTVAEVEAAGLEFGAIEEGEAEAFDPGTEFFHQVESERLASRPVGVEEADEGIEANCGEGGDAVVPKERVEKGKGCVDGVSRRSAVAAVEGKRRAD